ncbi:MAG: hypothetical protein WDA06_00060 [Phenylobacterium sp.]
MSEIEMRFSDTVLNEGEGEFDKVTKIMMSDSLCPKDWMLRSDVTMITDFGVSEFILHFYADGKIIIREYYGSMQSGVYNPEIPILNEWAAIAGWDNIEPHIELIEQDYNFWYHFWETNIINSSYFDQFRSRHDTSLDISEDIDDG